MENRHILILGSGHLSYRIKKLAIAKGYNVLSFGEDVFQLKDKNGSSYDKIMEVLKEVDLSNLTMAYLVDDTDEFNLQLLISLLSINTNLPITVSFFNENIAAHLKSQHPSLQILNPAKIAAPGFVDALYCTAVHKVVSPALPKIKQKKRVDIFMIKLLTSFLFIILFATFYFHFADGLSLLDSLYFVIVTIATVGYGDISLLNSSSLTKVVGMLLILSSTFFIWIIFSLTINRVISKRVQLALGRKKYNYKNHVILCGLGRLGHFVVEELIARGEKVVIIEANEYAADIEYFRNLGSEVYIGNGKLPRILDDVGSLNARAVIAITDDDFTNLEIGLNARSFNPTIKLVLRIFDEKMGEKIKENLDIQFSLSMSALADDAFLNTIED